MTTEAFLSALNDKFPHIRFELEEGRRWLRVVADRGDGSRSAYCFLDRSGNVYKANDWRRPAGGLRARLSTLDMARVDEYGSWLYMDAVKRQPNTPCEQGQR